MACSCIRTRSNLEWYVRASAQDQTLKGMFVRLLYVFILFNQKGSTIVTRVLEFLKPKSEEYKSYDSKCLLKDKIKLTIGALEPGLYNMEADWNKVTETGRSQLELEE